jgi:hypothetical protein
MVDALRCAGSERVVGDAVAKVVFWCKFADALLGDF